MAREHLDFNKWLDEAEAKDPENMCDPPISEHEALDFLLDYLLPSNWYVSMPETAAQVRTAAVFEILKTHSVRFQNELIRYEWEHGRTANWSWSERRYIRKHKKEWDATHRIESGLPV